ncbi:MULTISPECIES: siderophore-interacting protein [unclassified Psychrobacter]|uniref:siderophore-interacting protein n=1 Tax=unclassified Psychrobacter TaxID=196806 RepID=UPI0018F2D406|nr:MULTISPECIES: SIP domain-containing protein [unclassified Psychrobacter]
MRQYPALSTPSNTYTPFDMSSARSLLTDPEIAHIIDHLNEEHVDELCGFLTAFSPLTLDNSDDIDVKIREVYPEGIVIVAEPLSLHTAHTNSAIIDKAEAHFVAFDTPVSQLSDLRSQYITLKQKADKKRGKKTIKITEQHFEVEDSALVSANMLRVTLSNTPNPTLPVPFEDAGYAYLFDLSYAQKTHPERFAAVDEPREHCYYTLRKAWQQDGINRAWVDVFLHGDTSGGTWASTLQAGEPVLTKRELPEKIGHLQTGQTLLIADETSIPTVARLLELWDNPLAPIVLYVTGDARDQDYLNSIEMTPDLRARCTFLPLVTGGMNAGKDLAVQIDNVLAMHLADTPTDIEKVWGALEAQTAKALRGKLKTRLNLSRSDVVVKVYWRYDG